MGTLEPFMEAVHVLENETSTMFSFATMTEKFVPTTLQNSFNRKSVFSISLDAKMNASFYYWCSSRRRKRKGKLKVKKKM